MANKANEIEYVCGVCGERAKSHPDFLPTGWSRGPAVRRPQDPKDGIIVCSGSCKGRALEEAKPEHPGRTK